MAGRRLSREIERELAAIAAERVVVAAVKTIAHGDTAMFKALGLSLVGGELTAGDPSPPERDQGLYARRNLDGWRERQTDLPMEDREISHSAPNWHGGGFCQPLHPRIEPYLQRAPTLQRRIILAPVRRTVFRCRWLGHSPNLHTSIRSRNPFPALRNKAQLKRKKDARPVISPLALEALQQIDRIFDIEREINGRSADERLAARQERAVSLIDAFKTWMDEQRQRLSRHDLVCKAIKYLLNDCPGFTSFLDDGRICLTNNAAEREMRGVARGRKAWLFVGSDRGGERAAMMYSLIQTCRLNEVDPLAWLTDVLGRIADMPQSRVHELLPWHWKALRQGSSTEMADAA